VGSSDGVRLYRNRGSEHHWLQVSVTAPGSAYGTRLILRRGKEQQLRELQGGKGTTSQHSQTLSFGLGTNASPVTLEVRFPSGDNLKLKKILPDQRLLLNPEANSAEAP
jgi:hypothetical protein